MSFFFIQMTDPQFGFFAAISQLSPEQIDERRQRGLYVRLAPKKAGYSPYEPAGSGLRGHVR